MYGLSGEKVLPEKELPLAGFANNRPVRQGNNACFQRQNDVYGQLLTCLLPLYTDQRLNPERSRQKQYRHIGWLLERIEKTMDVPDAGVWEYRNSQQRHCFTYLFHWAGCKAALRIAREMGDDSLAARADALAGLSEGRIEQCYSERLGGYGQAIGVEEFDASSLQLITMRFLDPASKKTAAHLDALAARLKTKSGLMYRYRHEDDQGVPRTAFLACSFWFAEALACLGRTCEAAEAIDTALQCANHLGLLCEDADESHGQWGNFPQTYSHVGLINAVYRLSARLEKPLFL